MEEILNQIYLKLLEIFSPEVIGDFLAEFIIDLFVIFAVFVAFYSLWKVLSWISKPLFRKSNIDETTTIFVNSMIKYGVLIFGLITALDSVGIKTSAVSTSLGIVGLTIGFAARDSLSNIISGIIIYLDRPFVIGDLVEVDGNYGKVDRITLRSTRIVTVDGKMLAVPNVDVVNKTVASYTNVPHFRIDVPVTVALDEDLDKARSILLKLDDHLRNHGFILTSKGIRLSPAYEINPNPKGYGLNLNIDEHNNELNTELARSVAPYFRIDDAKAQSIITGIKKVVRGWEAIADSLSISRREKNEMAPAFINE